MPSSSLIFALSLQHAPYVGPISAKKLIAHCGSAEQVLKSSKKALSKIAGIGSRVVQSIHLKANMIAAESELSFMQKHNIKGLYFESEAYPNNLRHCVDGPIVLFQKGNVEWNQQPILSIIGTRNPTNYGIEQCERLIFDLKEFNPIIVSGFAYGIDICAQQTAFENNLQTVGCLAHNLSETYPKSHLNYRNNIEKQGGFVSEFWSNSNFIKSNFIKRNRIIAGISEATVIIESPLRGGSLITANFAFDYNKEVFAIPGRNTDVSSQGCNLFIQNQKSHLLTSAKDLADNLKWVRDTSSVGQQKKFKVILEGEELIISTFLATNGRSSLDEIAMECHLPLSKVAGLLIQLELKDIITPLPGKEFEVKHAF